MYGQDTKGEAAKNLGMKEHIQYIYNIALIKLQTDMERMYHLLDIVLNFCSKTAHTECLDPV